MRISTTAKALLTLTTILTITGCSSPGTTEDQPGAGESSSAAAAPSPSSTPGSAESENGFTITEIPPIEVASQQTKVSNELRIKLKNASSQFNYKDYFLTLVPVEGRNKVESGSVKFAVDSNLPPSCMEFEDGGDSSTCATLIFITTTSSEATDGKDVNTGYPAFFNLDRDVGKSILKVNIPTGASKAFAIVGVGDKTTSINVETGGTAGKYEPKLPWATPNPD